MAKRIRTVAENPALRRRWLLYAVGCLRAFDQDDPTQPFVSIVDRLDDIADGDMSTQADLRRDYRAGRLIPHGSPYPVRQALEAVVTAVLATHLESSFQGCLPACRRVAYYLCPDNRWPPSVYRCIFGPATATPIDPSWLSPTVVGLSTSMYTSRDFSGMPVLADALEEAGCDSPAIFQHCRVEPFHVRGDWLVDALRAGPIS